MRRQTSASRACGWCHGNCDHARTRSLDLLLANRGSSHCVMSRGAQWKYSDCTAQMSQWLSTGQPCTAQIFRCCTGQRHGSGVGGGLEAAHPGCWIFVHAPRGALPVERHAFMRRLQLIGACWRCWYLFRDRERLPARLNNFQSLEDAEGQGARTPQRLRTVLSYLSVPMPL